MLVTLAGALLATFTVTELPDNSRPSQRIAARTCQRAQNATPPVPAIAVAVSPAGRVSVTVTVPLVAGSVFLSE